MPRDLLGQTRRGFPAQLAQRGAGGVHRFPGGGESALQAFQFFAAAFDFAQPSGGGIAVNGLGGDDYIVTSNSKSQPDTVNGGDGNDLIFTGGGDDYVDGGDGNDVIHARGGIDTVIGGTGDDTYVFRFFGNNIHLPFQFG